MWESAHASSIQYGGGHYFLSWHLARLKHLTLFGKLSQLSVCIYMFMYEYMYVLGGMHVYTYMQVKPKVHVSCLPQLLQVLFLETGFVNIYCSWFSQIAGLQAAGILLSPPQSWKAEYMLLHLACFLLFHLGTRDSSAGPHSCSTSAQCPQYLLRPCDPQYTGLNRKTESQILVPWSRFFTQFFNCIFSRPSFTLLR